MSFLTNIKNALEDLTSLEVVTLHGGDVPLDSAIDEAAKAEIEAKIETQEAKVKSARTAWLNAEDHADKRKTRRAFRQEKRDLNALKTELYALSPSDIFSKVEIALGQASTVGYAKYEMGGDSVNFLNSSLGEQLSYLQEAHANNVDSALEVRQQLLDMGNSLLNQGKLD